MPKLTPSADLSSSVNVIRSHLVDRVKDIVLLGFCLSELGIHSLRNPVYF